MYVSYIKHDHIYDFIFNVISKALKMPIEFQLRKIFRVNDKVCNVNTSCIQETKQSRKIVHQNM